MSSSNFPTGGRQKTSHHSRGAMLRFTSPTTVSMMNQFVNGLKSKNEDMRVKAARDLHHFVSCYLKEILGLIRNISVLLCILLGDTCIVHTQLTKHLI